MLFQKKLFQGPSTLFRICRDSLVLKECFYEAAPENNCLTRVILHFFFVDRKVRKYASPCLDKPHQVSSRINSIFVATQRSPATKVHHDNENFDVKKKSAHNIHCTSMKIKRLLDNLARTSMSIMQNITKLDMAFVLVMIKSWYIVIFYMLEKQSSYTSRTVYISLPSTWLQHKNTLLSTVTSQVRVEFERTFMKYNSLRLCSKKCNFTKALKQAGNLTRTYASQSPTPHRSGKASVK